MAIDTIYGFHAVTAAINSSKVLKVYIEAASSHKVPNKRLAELSALCEELKIKIDKVDDHTLFTLVGEVKHQGVVAEVEAKNSLGEQDLYALLDKLEQPPFLLILDGVTDPHNLGACLRSAEAFGVHAVIAPADRACGLTPAARKVSSGAAERIAFVQVVNLARTLEALKKRGIWLAGLAGESKQTIYHADFKGPLAIIMGAEGEGMRRLTRESCDFLINIPMAGFIESLNVSVATGITLAEAARVRQDLSAVLTKKS
ncbi:23S rRNA mG2251 2'-O-ribose methyltransferase [Gammaproteobacteria bacterium]|nr:23S rRNA mG2251 2'-O-ribose methyltransferase [Gammaproteobacteria bacterium]